MTEPNRSSRREFLRGHAATEALLNVAQNALPTEMPPTPNGSGGKLGSSGNATPPDNQQFAAADENPAPAHIPQTYLVRVGRRAMACEFEVLLNAGQYADGIELAVAALDRVEQLEDQMTVYRESSEVSRLNRAAAARAVPVEPRLFELLELAVRIHTRTGGAYDITSGPLSKAWGFFRRAGRVPSDDDLAAAVRLVASEKLQLDAQTRTVRFPLAGMEINLGSIGKGYALDRVAEQLESSGLSEFMLHGGRSSVLARGSRSLVGEEGWWVGVCDPLRPTRRLGELRLKNRALATSGSGTQFFYHEGRRYGHILDPRTGRPAEGILSTTVVARTAAEADALSTAFYVLGSAAALDYCQRHSPEHGGLAAILISPGDRSGSVEIATFGLTDQDWRLPRG
jgi:thiamine biosynthesis lipoprotein